MENLNDIKTAIWSHPRIKRNIVDLQVAADKAGVRLPVTEIKEADKLLKSLTNRVKNKTPVPPADYKRYRDAKYKHQAANFPSWVADGHFIEPDIPAMAKATDLENFIIDFLTWSGHFANRTGNEGRVIMKNGEAKRIPSSSKRGMQDIDCNLKHSQHQYGIPWKIEVKYGKDTHKDHQRAFGAQVQQTGGWYSVVRNTVDFFSQYDQLLTGNVEQSSIFV